MRKLFIVFIAIYLSFFLTSKASEQGVNWQKVDENNYINYESIIRTEEIYGFMFMLKSFNKGQYEPMNGNKISYTVSQYTLDCVKQTYKIGVIDSYGSDGNFINGDYNRYAKFQPIALGTAVGEVSRMLCKP